MSMPVRPFALRRSLLAAVLSFAGAAAQADTLAQWNFNSPTPDGATSTGTLNPAVGSGIAAPTGGSTYTFASGEVSGGSSDPAGSDDSAWNIAGFAPQGSGDKTRGALFSVSTVGFDHITLSYDIRHSSTSSHIEALQYTVDGMNFLDAATFSADQADTWYRGRSFDFTGFAAVADNDKFAFRVVSAFDPSLGQYVATQAGSNYGSSGTWRFDMVTLQGQVLAVPEPGTYLMLALGLFGLGLWVRGRRGEE